MQAASAVDRSAAPLAKLSASERVAALHNFLRSLSILLKSFRIYGLVCPDTNSQLYAAWDDLYSCLQQGGDLELQAVGSTLLVNGEPMHTTLVERSFADLFTASSISGISFSARTSQNDFFKFAHAFATAGPKLQGLSQQLKEVFKDKAATIYVIETRCVETAEPKQEETKLGNPLVAAAQELPKTAGAPAKTSRYDTEEIRLLRLLGQIGDVLANPEATVDFGRLREELGKLSDEARTHLPAVVAGMAGSVAARERLLKIAERLAVLLLVRRAGNNPTNSVALQELLSRLA